MGTMNNGTSWNDAVTINKQSGTKITLDTDGKYVAKDIELTINVQAGSAVTPNTTITAEPTLSIDSSTGIITANINTMQSVSPTVSAGYVSIGSAGTMTVSGSKTLSLTTQAAQTITPSTIDKTIAAGKYLTGTQTIAGDSNLIAENIAEGVSIFGVEGTHSSGIDTSDANATANDILNGKTAYVNGSKVTGNIPSQGAQTITPGTTNQTIAAGKYLTGAQTIAGDSNLVAENIAEGVSIFGVTGTHSPGVDTSDATATANDILSNKTAYVNGSKITGNIPSKSSSNLTVSGATVTAPAGYYSTAATKTIDSGSTTQNAPTINSSTGLVTATATVTTGYQEESTKSNTLQLAIQEAQTITPSTANQTIVAGKYLTGAQTITGDSNLVSGNIKSGTSIFNVTGSFTDSSTVSSGQTAASASEILSGYSAWVNGVEVQGTMEIATVEETLEYLNINTIGRATGVSF